jgi:hypothetical protein
MSETKMPTGTQIVKAVEAFAYILEQEKAQPRSERNHEIVAAVREGLYALTGAYNVSPARQRATAIAKAEAA